MRQTLFSSVDGQDNNHKVKVPIYKCPANSKCPMVYELSLLPTDSSLMGTMTCTHKPNVHQMTLHHNGDNRKSGLL